MRPVYRSQRSIHASAILGLQLILAACSSDPKAADNTNFQHAIDSYFVNHPACTRETVFVPGTVFDPPPKYFVHMGPNLKMFVNASPGKYPDPVTLTPTNASNVGGEEVEEPLRKQLSALASAGLLTESTHRYQHAPAMLQPAWTEVDHAYAITPSASPLIHRNAGDPWSTLCFGTKTVDKIVNYTEPADNPLAGGIASTVRYSYSIGDVPSWAKRPDVQRSFPSISKIIEDAGKTTQEISLRKISTGWEVISMQ